MTNKVLITGITRGIGKAIAEKYKNNNWVVIGTGTSNQQLNYVDEYITCNFLDNSQLNEFCDFIKNKKIDVIINNAGINKINNFIDISPNEFLDIQQVNLYAPFRICQSILPYMLEQNWGRIINISSVWGKRSKTGRASYSASKFAIDGMTISLADEYSQHGILSNCVSPGFIDTDMTRKNLGQLGIEKILSRVPANRLASSSEVANFIYWLGSKENTYITGQNISIDGGFTRV